jgi:hypothetical protein
MGAEKDERKGKIYSITYQENPEEKYRCGSTLSLTSALNGRGWVKSLLSRFKPHKEAQYPLYRRLCGS